MRTLPACVVLSCALAASAGGAAPQAPRTGQTFRAGIDLVTVEVTAFDRDGRPVEDLRSGDFRVRLDGREREIVSLELVKVDAARAGEPADDDTPLVTTNVTLAAGRRVVVAVDQTLIQPGSAALLIRAAGDFVRGLTPDDRVALVTFPEPGPRVDFTKDRARVREALGLVVGQPGQIGARQLDVRLWEAMALDGETPENSTLGRTGPILQEVMERVCPELGGDPMTCRFQIIQQAARMRLEVRRDALFSARRLQAYLEELAAVDGPKSVVLISAGLVLEDPALLDEVARLAAVAQATVDVVAVEPQVDFERRRDPTFALQDRSLELGGLEAIADLTGGQLFRAIGPGTGIFEQIAGRTSAWYVVAVERGADDPADQQVEVEVRRRGVTVRARPRVVATAVVNAARPPAEVLRQALASPIAVPGIPLRVATFVQREPHSAQYRLLLAAQVGQPGEPDGEYAVGYVVFNEAGDVVASLGRLVALAPGAGGTTMPLPFDTAFRLDPGTYTIRFGVVDAGGRRGTIVRPVTLAPRSGGALATPDLAARDLATSDLATSDLIVGAVPAEGEVLHPGVEPYVAGGRVAGYLELYVPEAEAGALDVQLAVAEGEASPALVTERLHLAPGAEPGWRVATGAVTADLLPGRYVARATVLRGDEPLRVVTRPFVLAPREAVATADVPRDSPLPPALAQRMASYVGSVVRALSNVVAEERFTLTDPDRRVLSDFLLVRYPGADQDLLTFRDVVAVNDEPVPERQQRLEELFLQPIVRVSDRVQAIAQAAVRHVPPVLNPLYGLAFLQADFQSRFRMTAREAGDEWPAQVVAVAFEETDRPTILRAGPLGDADVPTRGTAWIEVGTGRLLQTELQVGTGRGAPRVVTRYRLDPALQIMVPELMRTENPRGLATYSNFRRFTVGTQTTFAADER